MSEENLFSGQLNLGKYEPLAQRVRPECIEDFWGQEHILGKGKLLYRLVKTNSVTSSIFFGPPGVGKTTLASIIAHGEGANFVTLNAVSSGVAEARAVIEQAKKDLEMYGRRTYLLLDECHRWSKAQSDQVLGAIEQGYIIFIGSTTENPFYSMTKAIVSRCRVFEFKPLSIDTIVKALKKAIENPRGLGDFKIEIDDEALKTFARLSNGDLRSALNSLELAVKSTPSKNNGIVTITKEIASESSGGRVLSINEDTYFDMLSAFCKSLRGSDPNASLYWAFRLIESGVDPEVILRRTIAHASEDVGLANNNAFQVATSALYAYKNLGAPEGFLALTHAIIVVATSPKSNSVVEAMESAKQAVKDTYSDPVPDHLKNYNLMKEKRKKYVYPHSKGGYVKQQYLPDSLCGKEFYLPKESGNETKVKEFMELVKAVTEKGFRPKTDK